MIGQKRPALNEQTTKGSRRIASGSSSLDDPDYKDSKICKAKKRPTSKQEPLLTSAGTKAPSSSFPANVPLTPLI